MSDDELDSHAVEAEGASEIEHDGSSTHDGGGAARVSGSEPRGEDTTRQGVAADGTGGADERGESAGAGEDPERTMSAKKQGSGEEKAGSFWKELPILIVIALVLAFVIKTWVVQPFFIPSRSMEDTLQVGDRVLVNKLVYQVRDIQRGDIVVFNGSGSWDEETVVTEPPATNPVSRAFSWVGQSLGLAPTGKDYIKRVIGVPGDTVECCDEENRVLVNGAPIEEPYLYPGSLESHQEFGPVTVEEGMLWVMGDHRAISYDSRTHQNDPGAGSIPEESVVGRAFVTIWPLNRITTQPVPETLERFNEEEQDAALAAPTGGTLAMATLLPLPVAARTLLPWPGGSRRSRPTTP